VPDQDEAPKEVPEPLGHRPVIPPEVNGVASRVPESLLERFRTAYVPDLSDAVGPLYTMHPGIRPLYSPMARVVGQALTVKAPPGDNLTVHGAFSMVRPGDVLVIDWRGYIDGCATGASSLAVPITHGLRGVVADGAWRDLGELRAIGFPICARGLSAFSPPKDRPGEINTAVSCGGVVVHPGDIVVGDEEGVVVIPLRWAETVLDSLSEYKAPTRVEDWDLAQLETSIASRRRRFRLIVESYGGRVRDEP
jgi:regulator of RNase E activity RraA